MLDRISDSLRTIAGARNFDLNSRARRHGLRSVAMPFALPLRDTAYGHYSFSGFLKTDSIYIHIPKAGGVSIANSLYGNIGAGHFTWAQYDQLFADEFVRRAFKFAIVRNPWDRIHSAFHFLSKGAGRFDFDLGPFRKAVGGRSFEGFVLDALPTAEVQAMIHFRPCMDFLRGKDGGIGHLDFIGRFENMEQDFATIAARVNPQASLLHMNRTDGSRADAYRRAYTPEMVDTVAGLYADGIAALGYAFEGGTPQVR